MMSQIHRAVIYYDIDHIKKEYIQQVAAKFGEDGLVHVHRRDARFDAPENSKIEVVESDRSAAFRNELMCSLNDLFGSLHKQKIFRQCCSYQGIDLLETIRYEFFYSICKPVHLLWVVDQLAQRYQYASIILVCENSDNILSTLEIPHELNCQTEVLSFVQKYINKNYGSKNDTLASSIWRIAGREIRDSALRSAESIRKKITHNSTDFGEKKKILFIENFPNSAKISAAVANELTLKANLEVKFVATRSLVAESVSEIYPPILLHETGSILTVVGIVIRQALMAVFVIIGRYLLPLWKKETNGIFHLVTSTSLSNYLLKFLLRAIYHVSIFSEFEKKWQPNLVATTSVNGIFARAAVLRAQKERVLTCFLQHGIIFGEPYEMYLLQDCAIVWGKYFKDLYLKSLTINPGNIYISGSPKFDKYFDQNNRSWEVASSNQKIHVVYFPSLVGGSTVSAEMSMNMLEMVVEAVGEFENIFLTVKVKTDDKSTFLSSYESNKGLSLNRSGDVFGILREADIVIVSTSTVGLEACVLNKPIVILALDGVQVPNIYREYQAAVYVNTTEELVMGLTTLTKDQDFKRNLMMNQDRLTHDLFGNPVSGAVGRIADIISSLVE